MEPADTGSEEPSDETLMLAYQSGDAASFDRLYRRHKGPLYRYFSRGCGNAAEAQEMFQDVWMNLIRTHRDYRPTARFTTYLYRLAHNRLIDGWRRRRPQTELSDELPAETPGPEQIAMQQQLATRLMHLIAGLPMEQREAVLLQEERGFTLEEIASVTGVGRETVKSRLRYALEKLRRGMRDD